MSDSRKRPWYLWPNLLGLDAPIVAVVWAAFYVHLQDSSLPRIHLLVLAAAVWCVYMTDRLADVRYLREREAAFSPRHGFARSLALPLGLAVLLVGSLGFYGAGWILPGAVFLLGLAIGVAGLLYLLLVWSPRRPWAAALLRILLALALGWACIESRMPTGIKVLYGALLVILIWLSLSSGGKSRRIEPPKELVAGLLFSVGTLLPAAFFTSGGVGSVRLGQLLTFWFLCTLNCLAIGWFERELDREGDPASVAQRFPLLARMTPVGCAILAGWCLFLRGMDGQAGGEIFYLAVGLSALLLLALTLAAPRLSPNLQRVLADVVLLTPLFFLWG